MADATFPEWSSEWPVEPGFYWFYGVCFSSSPADEMFFVRVRRTATGHFMYITNGHFVYPSEGAKGQWLPAAVPEPPAGNGEV